MAKIITKKIMDNINKTLFEKSFSIIDIASLNAIILLNKKNIMILKAIYNYTKSKMNEIYKINPKAKINITNIDLNYDKILTLIPDKTISEPKLYNISRKLQMLDIMEIKEDIDFPHAKRYGISEFGMNIIKIYLEHYENDFNEFAEDKKLFRNLTNFIVFYRIYSIMKKLKIQMIDIKSIKSIYNDFKSARIGIILKKLNPYIKRLDQKFFELSYHRSDRVIKFYDGIQKIIANQISKHNNLFISQFEYLQSLRISMIYFAGNLHKMNELLILSIINCSNDGIIMNKDIRNKLMINDHLISNLTFSLNCSGAIETLKKNGKYYRLTEIGKSIVRTIKLFSFY